MGYIDGFTYDIFISYSHIDNEKSAGQALSWVEQFYKDLSVLLWQSLGTRQINIWWDNKRLDGGVFFDDAIEKGITGSAIFLCLNSPSFLKSDYCQKELDLFYQKAQKEEYGLRINDRSRIMNVLLYNINHTQWPFELSGTTGFHFHTDVDEDKPGDPVDFTDVEYKHKLHELRDSLVALIEILKDPPPPAEPKFTLYFGDVSDSLRITRNKLIASLKNEGYNILQDVPPPFDEDEHEEAVTQALQNASLAIHMLDEYPGREIQGAADVYYPQKQAELSLHASAPKLFWVPAQLNLDEIEVPAYKKFISDLSTGTLTAPDLDFIKGSKSELPAQVNDLIVKIVSERTPQKPSGQLSVLLDTHYKDQAYAFDLGKSMLEKDIQPFINPENDDPRKNINILKERISEVSKLIFFYGRAPREWVLQRMSAALQFIVESASPVEDFCVFMVPPHKESNDITLNQRFLKINVFNYSDNTVLDQRSLSDFFNKIRS